MIAAETTLFLLLYLGISDHTMFRAMSIISRDYEVKPEESCASYLFSVRKEKRVTYRGGVHTFVHNIMYVIMCFFVPWGDQQA